MRRISFNADPTCAAFGLSVGQSMVEVDGVVLPPPSVQYGSGAVVPENGVWRLGGRFLEGGAAVASWGVLVLDDHLRSEDVATFVKALTQTMRQTAGVAMPAALPPMEMIGRNETLDMAIERVARNAHAAYGAKMQLLLSVMPEKDGITYSQVMRAWRHTYTRLQRGPYQHLRCSARLKC